MKLYLVDNKGKINERNAPITSWAQAHRIAQANNMRLATPQDRKNYLIQQEKIKKEKEQRILKNPNIKHIQLVTSLTSPDGYGNTGRYFYNNCLDHDVYLNDNFDLQDVGLCYFPPVGITELKTKKKVLYTMFESTRFPKEWERYVNYADHIIVPSTMCQKLIKDQFNRDCTVISLGYDEDKFYPLERKRTGLEPYTFLHYDAFKMRKGWNLVFKAFVDEFGENNPDVKLILKTTEHTKVPFSFSYYKNIEVIRANYEHEELIELHKRSDCFVFPSIGEGFGLPVLEAMRTGLYTIASNHTGMADFVRPTLTEFKKIQAIYDKIGLRGCDVEQDLGFQLLPDIEQLKKEMRKAFNERLKGNYPEIADLTMRKSLVKLSKFLKEIC